MTTTNNRHIYYQKWNKKNYKHLFKSIRDILKSNSLQFYMPLYSLYFYIHNTKNSNKTIDLRRNFYLLEINEIIKERYYNSNLFLKGKILNSSKNIIIDEDIFCKTIPIIDPIHTINNNYNIASIYD